jgi:hypothetical protein
MPRFVTAILVSIALALTAGAARAETERRVALVIGNEGYQYLPRLATPVGDAQLIASTLQSLGFELIGGKAQTDLDRPHFEQAIAEFGKALAGGAVGLFYYAGHGVAVQGSNYLVPIGANPTTVADADLQLVNADIVLKQMEAAGSKLNIMILDACRNNPFGGRGLRDVGAGLAQMRAPRGTLISYATQPGNVALDGDGHSPYTAALSEAMRRPGLEVWKVFNEVGLAVDKVTGSRQQPWTSNSPLEGTFYFLGPTTTTSIRPTSPDPDAALRPPPPNTASPAPSAPAAVPPGRADQPSHPWPEGRPDIEGAVLGVRAVNSIHVHDKWIVLSGIVEAANDPEQTGQHRAIMEAYIKERGGYVVCYLSGDQRTYRCYVGTNNLIEFALQKGIAKRRSAEIRNR